MTETEQARAHELLYSCDSREELCGRVAELEKLVRDMWREHECCYLTWPAAIADRMRALGLEESE